MEQHERFAVVGPVSKLIKDFYLVPLFRDKPIPAALISLSKGIDCKPFGLTVSFLLTRINRL
jgi:hypothetical protein